MKKSHTPSLPWYSTTRLPQRPLPNLREYPPYKLDTYSTILRAHFKPPSCCSSAPIARTFSLSPSPTRGPIDSSAAPAPSNTTLPSLSFRDDCTSVSREKTSLAVPAPGTMRRRVLLSVLPMDAMARKLPSSRSRFAVLMSL